MLNSHIHFVRLQALKENSLNPEAKRRKNKKKCFILQYSNARIKGSGFRACSRNLNKIYITFQRTQTKMMVIFCWNLLL